MTMTATYVDMKDNLNGVTIMKYTDNKIIESWNANE